MGSRTSITSLPFCLLAVLFCGSAVASQPSESKTPQVKKRSPDKCPSPSIALISPEFVVLDSAPQQISFGIIAHCFNQQKNKLFLVAESGTSLPLEISKAAETDTSKVEGTEPIEADSSQATVTENSKPEQTEHSPATAVPERQMTITAAGSVPSSGVYTVCIANADQSGCGSQLTGPTVLAVAAAACNDASNSASLPTLKSETPMHEPEPPGLTDQCSYDDAYADKAIMIDAESGRTCTSPTTESPDDGCFQNKKPEKKPLQLRAGDTVRLYVTRKNPFLRDYKFTSTDSQIKDDDIGTFLNMLVPGLTGASGQKGATGDKGGAATGTTTALENKAKSAAANTQVVVAEINKKNPTDVKSKIEIAQNQQTDTFYDLEVQVASLQPAAPERQHIAAMLDEAALDLAQVKERENKISATPTPQQKPDLEAIGNALSESSQILQQAAKVMAEKERAAAARIQQCVSQVGKRVDNLVTNYAFFAQAYNRERIYLLSADRSCDQLSRTAIGLWRLVSYEQSKILDSRLDLNLRDGLAALASGTKPADGKGDNGDSRTMKADSKSLTGSFCVLKAIRKEIAPALSAAAAGLEKVLVNPTAFRSEILIGPFADATQVDWTLQRTMTQPPINPMDSASFNAALDDCLSKGDEDSGTPQQQHGTTPQDPKNPKNPKTGGSDNSETPRQRSASLINASLSFPASANDQSQDSTNTSNTTKKKDNKTQDDNSPGQKQKGQATTADSSTTTRGRRVNFGSERFIVSAGLTGSPLALREFGKGVGQAFDDNGKPLAGQTTANIITLKTDQSYRLSPMLFLNSRIYQWSGRAEALYATFGITAKSDSNGTAPEYVIGLSQSLLQRHLLFTAGAYAGRQQKLTGGLYVNEAIPSNLTGDIPTQSNYHINVGFSVSWRIPGLAK